MTHDEEQRLRSLLDEAAPVPPTTLDGPRLRSAAGRPTRSRGVDRALALVALAAVVVGVVGVVWWAGRSGSAVPDGEPQPSVSPFDCASLLTYQPPKTSGTAPATLPASAFGPYAVQDPEYKPWTGADGRAVYHVYPNGPVHWSVFSFTRSYASDQLAAQSVADLTAIQQCASSGEILHPAGAGEVPGAVFARRGNAATWYVFVRVGSKVMTFDVSAESSSGQVEAPADGPGDAFLVGAAAAARRSMTGEDVGSIPLPSPTPSAPPSPSGFLAPSVIGEGWQIGNEAGDELHAVTKVTAPGPDCNGVPVAHAQPGQALVYRGRLPGAPDYNSEWLLTEQVVTLTPAGREKALAQLAAAADGSLCPRTTVLFSGAGIAGDYVLAEGEKTGGTATVYVVSGDRFITLLSLPGGAMGTDVPIPGGDQWLKDTAKSAVDAAGS